MGYFLEPDGLPVDEVPASLHPIECRCADCKSRIEVVLISASEWLEREETGRKAGW